MPIQFSNYSETTLVGSLAPGTTSITVVSITGFPVANGASNYWYATLADFATGGLNQLEYIKVTNQAGNVLTVTRGIDGTAAQSWPPGSLVDCRWTAQTGRDVIASAGAPANLSFATVLNETGTLTNSRQLAATSPIVGTDGGAGTTFTYSLLANGVTNAFLATMATHTVKGNITGGTATPTDVTMAQLNAILPVFVASGASHAQGIVPDPGVTAGTTHFLREDATWVVPPGTGAGTTPTYLTLNTEATLTNSRKLAVGAELTLTDGGALSTYTIDIAANGVTLAMLSQATANTILGNNTGSTANVADLTTAQVTAMLNVFLASGASHAQGLVPDPGGSAGSTRFLREDANWAVPPGGAGSAFVPNLFRNSGMVINQRPTQTVTTSALIGSVDGWAVWVSTGTTSAGTITQSSSAPVGQTGYALFLQTYTTAGAGVVSCRQRIESKDAIRLKNQTVSIQFNVYQDTGAAINYVITVNSANATDNFSATTNVVTSGNISVNSATPTQVSFQNQSFNAACANGFEVVITAAVGAVTTKNLYWTEAEVHLGANAQTYQYVPFVEDLVRCERYYHKSFVYSTAPAQNAGNTGAVFFAAVSAGAVSQNIPFAVSYPVNMRTTPTVTFYNPAAANAQFRNIGRSLDWSACAISGSSDKWLFAFGTGCTGQLVADLIGFHFTADADTL